MKITTQRLYRPLAWLSPARRALPDGFYGYWLVNIAGPVLAELTPNNLQVFSDQMARSFPKTLYIEDPSGRKTHWFIRLIIETAINKAECSELYARLLKNIALNSEQRFKTEVWLECFIEIFYALKKTRRAVIDADCQQNISAVITPNKENQAKEDALAFDLKCAAQEAKKRCVALGHFIVEVYQQGMTTKGDFKELIEEASAELKDTGIDAVMLFGRMSLVHLTAPFEAPKSHRNLKTQATNRGIRHQSSSASPRHTTKTSMHPGN